eukprot:7346180-Prymnesium_polylepis.2
MQSTLSSPTTGWRSGEQGCTFVVQRRACCRGQRSPSASGAPSSRKSGPLTPPCSPSDPTPSAHARQEPRSPGLRALRDHQ